MLKIFGVVIKWIVWEQTEWSHKNATNIHYNSFDRPSRLNRNEKPILIECVKNEKFWVNIQWIEKHCPIMGNFFSSCGSWGPFTRHTDKIVLSPMTMAAPPSAADDNGKIDHIRMNDIKPKTFFGLAKYFEVFVQNIERRKQKWLNLGKYDVLWEKVQYCNVLLTCYCFL